MDFGYDGNGHGQDVKIHTAELTSRLKKGNVKT